MTFPTTRLRNAKLALLCFPGLVIDPRQRALLAEMRDFCRHLPAALKQPIPKAMVQLTPESDTEALNHANETATRNLADFASLLERSSSLGLCLRRSLIRYHYLRKLGIPAVIQFGARFVERNKEKEITGHAWITIHGQPYHEEEANWRGFQVMFTWPMSSSQDDAPAAS